MIKNLILQCPINNMGYGITSYNIWKALSEKIQKIFLFPIGDVTTESYWNKEKILSDFNNQNQYEKHTPCLKIWHPKDLITKPHTERSIYATYSFFETDHLSTQEITSYNVADIIFTPTNWARQILINHGIISSKIVVLPSGVDREIFNEDISIDPDESNTENSKYIFLNIGKWEIRKGHDILVHMFNKAFSEKDDVELWMLNYNSFLSSSENDNWAKLYKNSKLGDKIKIFPRLPTQQHIAKLIKMSHCGIYPIRAEGWNNEALETMSMNKPVILTNYSGHTEYATKENSYLSSDIHQLEPALDGKFFKNEQAKWASLTPDTIDSMISHMRFVYKNKVHTNPKGLETSKQLSWQNTANIVIKHLYT